MIGNLKIYEVKPLKGPDRLLRMNVVIEDAIEISSSIGLLAEVVTALIIKHHNLNIEFPISFLLEVLPSNLEFHAKKYGEYLNVALGLDMLFMSRSDSVFKIRYYPSQLEFQRDLMRIDTHVLLHKIDMNEYEHQYTNGQLRDGLDSSPLNLKITYSKARI